MNYLELINVSKKLKGKCVLDGVNMKLYSGNIYGLVGANGSGKTMIIRTIAGLMKPDDGEVKFDDKILYKDIDFIPKSGLIIENISLYPEFNAVKNLELLAAVNNYITKSEILKAIERVGLDPDDNRPIKKYSLGMKQKLTLAQAIMEQPQLMLLDEPSNALDENSVSMFHDICKEESSKGAIILIATHNASDIDQLCSQTFRIENGKII